MYCNDKIIGSARAVLREEGGGGGGGGGGERERERERERAEMRSSMWKRITCPIDCRNHTTFWTKKDYNA